MQKEFHLFPGSEGKLRLLEPSNIVCGFSVSSGGHVKCVERPSDTTFSHLPGGKASPNIILYSE